MGPNGHLLSQRTFGVPFPVAFGPFFSFSAFSVLERGPSVDWHSRIMPERMGSGYDSINQSINQSINRNYLPFPISIFAAMSSTAYLS